MYEEEKKCAGDVERGREEEEGGEEEKEDFISSPGRTGNRVIPTWRLIDGHGQSTTKRIMSGPSAALMLQHANEASKD